MRNTCKLYGYPLHPSPSVAGRSSQGLCNRPTTSPQSSYFDGMNTSENLTCKYGIEYGATAYHGELVWVRSWLLCLEVIILPLWTVTVFIQICDWMTNFQSARWKLVSMDLDRYGDTYRAYIEESIAQSLISAQVTQWIVSNRHTYSDCTHKRWVCVNTFPV